MINPVADIKTGRRRKRDREVMRAEARAEYETLKDAGKCSKRPAGLIAPACTFDPDHDGRCSWGAHFEPNGEFHALDPDGPYPTPGPFSFGTKKQFYCGWCDDIGWEGMFGPGPDDTCSQCGRNLNDRCPRCNGFGHASKRYPWLRSHRDHCPQRPIWRTVKNLLDMYYRHACGIGCADYIRKQELDFLRKQLHAR